MLRRQGIHQRPRALAHPDHLIDARGDERFRQSGMQGATVRPELEHFANNGDLAVLP